MPKSSYKGRSPTRTTQYKSGYKKLSSYRTSDLYSTDKVKLSNPEYEYSSEEDNGYDTTQDQILSGNKLISTVLDFLDGKPIDLKIEKALLYYLMKSGKCELNQHKSACEISKGAFGKAYKLQEEEQTIVVKVPRIKKRTEYGFDVKEAEFQDMAYMAFVPNFPPDYIPIAKSLGYWESPSLAKFLKRDTNFCFVIDYINSLAPFSKLIGDMGVNNRDFKGLLFQCAIALHTLQSKIQGFCHNDMHGYNILVVKGNPNKTYKIFGKAFTAGRYQIKIIDFGMASSLDETTYDGEKYHLTHGNPAVDFLQICNKCILYGYRFMDKNFDRKPEWLGELLQFLGNYFPNELIKNGNGSDLEGKWLHKSFVSIKHPDGIKWINKNFPPKTFPFKTFLLDPFFDSISKGY